MHDLDVGVCPECGEPVDLPPGGRTTCGVCGAAVGAADAGGPGDRRARARREIAELEAERSRQNKLSFAFGVPGILLQIGGRVGVVAAEEGGGANPVVAGLGLLALLAGFVLFIVGCAYFAKYKGRHGAWGLLGLVGCIGLLGLLILPDHKKQRIIALQERVGGM